MLKPIAFKTKNDNWYIYDNKTRFVLPINDVELCENDLDKNGNVIEVGKIHQIKNKYKKYPLFEDFDISNEMDIWVEGSKDFITSNGIRQLTLIITEACNFRCKYCFYSDEYEYSRNHSKNMMDWSIAKKSIDYYFNFNKNVLTYNPNFKPTIGFYGGEPLLNWDVIYKSVEYIKDNYASNYKEVFYTITTNGYLLNSEKSKYLLDNGFSIAVSLDGNKEDHNRNRILHNREKTYDSVIRNIIELDRIYRDLSRENNTIYPYTLLMTYDNNTSFSNTIKAALEMPDIFNKFRKINKVKSMNTNYYNGQRGDKEAYADVLDIVNSYIDGNSNGTNIETILFNQLTLFQANNVNLVNNTSGGTCIPGEKLAVTHSGDMYICERIDYQSSIGNIDEGINWNLQKKYLEDFISIKKSYCKSCNISNLCNLCFANCSCGDDKFFMNEEYCNKYKHNITKLFSLYYTALENGQVSKV
ncbi:radical SAM protein [Peptoniphilus phoceensis]|uniref:radical SAM protein n=1 Tax=Peptoniphilus phoceensis TaxID=1720298 RepID=UPI0007841334|nr:radical SAM protein [Peptoniphilus phoceensis]